MWWHAFGAPIGDWSASGVSTVLAFACSARVWRGGRLGGEQEEEAGDDNDDDDGDDVVWSALVWPGVVWSVSSAFRGPTERYVEPSGADLGSVFWGHVGPPPGGSQASHIG